MGQKRAGAAVEQGLQLAGLERPPARQAAAADGRQVDGALVVLHAAAACGISRHLYRCHGRQRVLDSAVLGTAEGVGARHREGRHAPTVRVDGALVLVTEAETGLLNIVLPADNLFGRPAGTQGQSYGHGWVTLLSPPSLGTHKIVITSGSSVITTMIKVR
jgi:hypothetical protein